MHKEREFILSFISLQNDVYNLLDIGEYKRICINGEETKYLINSLGFIINTNYKNKGKIQVKKSYADSRGYQKLTIHHKKDYSIRVHRLVAEAFIPNPLNLKEINHKDENKENNTIDNLEWCDRKYNCNYGTTKQKIREKIIKKVYQYDTHGKLIKIYNCCQECELNGYKPASIYRCCRKKTEDYIKTIYGLIKN